MFIEKTKGGQKTSFRIGTDIGKADRDKSTKDFQYNTDLRKRMQNSIWATYVKTW